MEISVQLANAINDYKQGNKEAFNTIYKESEKYIYSCIYKIVKGNDNAIDMAADVMGDTYLEISKSIGQLSDDKKFLSWAGTIATRKCYAYLKKNKKYVLLNEEDNTFEQLADDDNIIPEEIMQKREAQRLLREIIDNELNEMQRLCIIGVYYNGQKQSELAKELGIPENTVKTHLSRAKAKIKAGVEELDIRKGTRLFSVAPLFILLFTEDVQACEVPEQVRAKVFEAAGISAKAGIAFDVSKGNTSGIKSLLGKIVSASVKTKIIGTIAVFGIAGLFATMRNQQKNNWEAAFEDFIKANQDIIGFDLNDFDEDGVPELVANYNNDRVLVQKYDEGKFNTFADEKIGTLDKKQLPDNIDSMEIVCGYGSDYNEMIIYKYFIYNFNDEQIWVPSIIDKHYNGTNDVSLISYRDSLIQARDSENGAYKYYESKFYCSSKEEEQGKKYSFEKWIKEVESVMSRFNLIEFSGVTQKEIKERITEFKNSGNRPRSNNSFDWNRYDERKLSTKENMEPEENVVDLNVVCDDYYNQVGGDELYRFIHDFDKDGKQEAFLILGEYNSEGSHIVRDFSYFNSKGERTNISISDRGDSATLFGYVSGDKIIETETRDYFVWEKDAFGSASISYIFSVKNGEYFEPEISGKYMNFSLQRNGNFKGLENDFSSGYHDYIETEFVLDKNSGEFIKK